MAYKGKTVTTWKIIDGKTIKGKTIESAKIESNGFAPNRLAIRFGCGVALTYCFENAITTG